MKNSSNKTEKELFDEAMEKWPEELELEANEINQTFNLIEEDRKLNLNNEDEILRYCSDCIPWNEFVKDWIK